MRQSLLSVAALLSLLAVSLPAQSVPNVLHFQARLSDNVGGPLAGDTAVTVRVYDVESGGAPLWQETHVATAVNGVVSLTLVDPVALPTDLFSGGPRWIAL